MDARAEVLARVRAAQARAGAEPARAGAAPPGEVERRYRARSDLAAGSAEAVDLLADRLVDYRAGVHRCAPRGLAGVLAALLGGEDEVVVPPGLPAAWATAVAGTGARVRVDVPPLPHAALDAATAVVTGARVAIAETGVLVLDAEPDQGRRALSLVPDHHVCLVRRRQVVATVPEAVAVLARHPERPTTWIAGPSATSDIELVRVEGVHGPRVLDVVVVG